MVVELRNEVGWNTKFLARYGTSRRGGENNRRRYEGFALSRTIRAGILSAECEVGQEERLLPRRQVRVGGRRIGENDRFYSAVGGVVVLEEAEQKI